jgi:hypothetical protein
MYKGGAIFQWKIALLICSLAFGKIRAFDVA